MAANFLEQLTQSGALRVVNPMESYQNALSMKAVQTNIRGAELDQEGKLLDIGRGIFKNVQSKEDLTGAINHMVKLGADPNLFKGLSKAADDKEAVELAGIASMTADELFKLKQGDKIELFNKKTGDSYGSFTQDKNHLSFY